MTIVAELSAYSATNAALTYRFSMGGGVSLPDADYIPSGLTSWTAASEKISISDDGVVSSDADTGEIVVTNLPDSFNGAGPLDALADMPFAGRTANLYKVDSTWAGRVLLSSGIMEQPTADMNRGSSPTGALRWVLRDPRAGFAFPLQPATYGGTNVGATGVDGTTSDIIGALKPILYGRVSNLAPIQVNAQLLAYQVSDKPAAINCVRDGGIGLNPGVQVASLAALQTTVPAPASYNTYSGPEGCFFRLGSKSTAVVTVDAQEGATLASRTHAQIWSRIRTERCGTPAASIDTAAVAAADALDSAEAGFWWTDAMTQADALNEVLGSFSGFEILTTAGLWRMAKLIQPAGPPKVRFVMLMPQARVLSTDRKIMDLERVRPSYAPNGAPPYQINVEWGRSYDVMSSGDFNGGAGSAIVAKFSQEWRTETRSNNAIWNPTTLTGPWPTSTALTITTGYQTDATGVTSAGAITEANRLAALYGVLRGQYQVGFRPESGDYFQVGDVVQMQIGAMGLSTGPLFKVLQAGLVATKNRLKVELIIGLQT